MKKQMNYYRTTAVFITILLHFMFSHFAMST